MGYITWAEFLSFCLVIIGIISVIFTIYRKK